LWSRSHADLLLMPCHFRLEDRTWVFLGSECNICRYQQGTSRVDIHS
jgi:hypothetical protein